MPTDIFGRESLSFGGAFAADSCHITFASAGTCMGQVADLQAGVGLLAQNLQFTYQQPIQRFFELGDNYIYYFAGRPQGQGAIMRLLGPRIVSETFYTVLGNVCCGLGNNIRIDALASCGGETEFGIGTISWLLKGVVLNSVGAAMQCEDMIYREQLTFVFYALEFDGGGSDESGSDGMDGTDGGDSVDIGTGPNDPPVTTGDDGMDGTDSGSTNPPGQ